MIPNSVKGLTVSKYMECVDIYHTPNLDLIDREILILSRITGKTEQYYSELPMNELVKQFAKVPVLSIDNLKDVRLNKYIFIKGWLYKAVINPGEINVALYRDLKTYIDKGIDKNLHKILACIYRPVLLPYTTKCHERTAKLMLNQKIGHVSGAVFFYSDILKRLNPLIQTYLEQTLIRMEKNLKNSQELQAL